MGQKENLERSVLKYGGLAGILGGIVFLFVPIVQFGFVPPAPSDPSQVVARFPSISVPLTIGNNINFVADIFYLELLVALYRGLRGTSLAPALFGTAMSIMGLAVLFTETQTQVAFAPISDIYHQAGTTAAQQQTLGYVWQGTQGMFFELDVAIGLLLSLGFVIIGIAMIRAPGFRQRSRRIKRDSRRSCDPRHSIDPGPRRGFHRRSPSRTRLHHPSDPLGMETLPNVGDRLSPSQNSC